MNVNKYQLEHYRKHLLNRVTVTPHFIEYVENCLASEDEAAHHSFHKIMVHNWAGSSEDLFDTIAEYFSPSFIPVNYTSQGTISTFYTSSLSLVLKITKLDFMFPHKRNMFSVDILFNDKTSADCFENRIKIEDIVAGVVTNRLNEKFELNLSDFCNDPEFMQKKIHFYKINLLAQFKILMLRIGRDTKTLNLSNNNLSHVPIDILNFFIKGDLVAVNLSNNDLQSIQEIYRVSSKIEKLWVEGNPLCEELDPVAYVRHITKMFPRLMELDGIKLNSTGVVVPFFKNYLVTTDKRTKMLVEKFLSVYFTYYDTPKRKGIDLFYDQYAFFCLVTNFAVSEEKTMERYTKFSRNLLNPNKNLLNAYKSRQYKKRDSLRGPLVNLPPTEHDPTTFTVDVIKHDKKSMVLVVDGVFREVDTDSPEVFHFRRTFIIEPLIPKWIKKKHILNTQYVIKHEIFSLSFATQEMIEHSFKNSTRGTNPLALQNPDAEDVSAVCNVFSHLTQLKKTEVETRLKKHNYDITRALKDFMNDVKEKVIPADMFYEDDDFSDTSSLIDDELDSS